MQLYSNFIIAAIFLRNLCVQWESPAINIKYLWNSVCGKQCRANNSESGIDPPSSVVYISWSSCHLRNKLL